MLARPCGLFTPRLASLAWSPRKKSSLTPYWTWNSTSNSGWNKGRDFLSFSRLDGPRLQGDDTVTAHSPQLAITSHHAYVLRHAIRFSLAINSVFLFF
jgi:hypothetical protein